MTYQLGIDLGTTFTAAAVHRDGRQSIFSLGNHSASIPSVVLLREDGTELTGEAAARRALSEPERVAREFKRRMGDQTPIIVGGSPYSSEQLSARLLSATVAAVAEREGGPPSRIAITHPANWGNYKIDLLHQAVRLAGIPSERVEYLTEPEAAAISYATQERVEPGEIVAVYDLGGGTFDAAVLRRTPDGFEVIGRPEGIERMGGIDFDAAVFAHVDRALDGKLQELDPEDPSVVNAVARLREECVQAKIALSSDTDATIPVLLPDLQTEVRITRREFENLIRPSLGDSIEAMRRALESAGVTPDQVAKVLLVGGSSRIPLISQLVSSELGRPVAVDADPKHAIALGAAAFVGHALSDDRGAAGAGTAAAAAAAGAAAAAAAATAAPTLPPTEPVVGTAAATEPPVGAAPVTPTAGQTTDEVGLGALAAGAGASPSASGAEPGATPTIPAVPTAAAPGAPVAPTGVMPAAPPPGTPGVPGTAPVSGPSGSGGGSKTPWIISGVIGVVALIVVGVLVFGGGDDGDDSADPVETPVATDVVDSADPVVTDPIVTDPPTTDPVETEPPATEPPTTEPVVVDDGAIQQAVQSAVGPGVGVSVAGGVVTLTGQTDEATAAAAVAAAQGTAGVVEVVNAMQILAADEVCSELIQSRERWACVTAATFDGTNLVVDFVDSGAAWNSNGGFHFHFYDGGQDVTTVGTGADGVATGTGVWQVWDQPGQFVAPPAAVGGDGTGRVCVVIATAAHDVADLESGNCFPII